MIRKPILKTEQDLNTSNIPSGFSAGQDPHSQKVESITDGDTAKLRSSERIK